jgi:hypothetical protein
MGHGSHVSAQLGGKKASRREVAMVLQVPRDGFVRVFVVIEKEGGGIGILQGLIVPAQALQDGVELVGHGVVYLLPVVGKRNVGLTPDAEMLFPCAQRISAHQTGARHGQIGQGFSGGQD